MEENCSQCGENSSKLYLHSICHIESATWAILDKEKSEIEIICGECKKSIVKFRVLRIVK
jgi:uncharacterized CHY-type Zn-finger protein